MSLKEKFSKLSDRDVQERILYNLLELKKMTQAIMYMVLVFLLITVMCLIYYVSFYIN